MKTILNIIERLKTTGKMVFRGIICWLQKTYNQLIKLLTSKWFCIFILIQIIIVLIVFLFFGYLPVLKEKKELKIKTDTIIIDKNEKEVFEAYNQTQSKLEYLKSEMFLARTDSIYLVINFSDSSAQLLIKGVSVHSAKILSYSCDNGLKNLPNELINKKFVKPLQVIDDESTIEKFPIVLKKAPKDTVEAQQVEQLPSAPNQSDVFYTLYFNDKFMVDINQEENEFLCEKSTVRSFFIKQHKKQIRQDIDSLLKFSIPSYRYKIKIKMLREDARSIYRGLPVYPYVLIKL